MSEEGVPVLGVIKCGVMHDIARRGMSVFGRNADNVLPDLSHACAMASMCDCTL